jgi:hypothetical protein
MLKERVLRKLRSLGLHAFNNSAGLGVGSPDIVVVLPPLGVFVGLELKIGDREQSEGQVAWQREHEKLGGLYYVVHTVTEAVHSMKAANFEMWRRIDAASRLDVLKRKLGKKIFPGSHRFRAPLHEDDTPNETAGCRHTNSKMCVNENDPEVCAYSRNDGTCLAPPTGWPEQFNRLHQLGLRKKEEEAKWLTKSLEAPVRIPRAK